MSVVIRCRRCGAEFVADRFDVRVRVGRLCPWCRGAVPRAGCVPAVDGDLLCPVPPDTEA